MKKKLEINLQGNKNLIPVILIVVFLLVIVVAGAILLKVNLPLPKIGAKSIEPSPGPTPAGPINVPNIPIIGNLLGFLAKVITFFLTLGPTMLTAYVLCAIYYFASFFENKTRGDLTDVLVHIFTLAIAASIFLPGLRKEFWPHVIAACGLVGAFFLSLGGPTGKPDFSPAEDHFAGIFFIGALAKSLGLVGVVFHLNSGDRTWYTLPQVLSFIVKTDALLFSAYVLTIIALILTLRLEAEKKNWLIFVLSGATVLESVIFVKNIVAALAYNPSLGVSLISYLAATFAILINMVELARLQQFWPGFISNIIGCGVVLSIRFLAKTAWYVPTLSALVVTILLGVLLTKNRKATGETPTTGFSVGQLLTMPWETVKMWALFVFLSYRGF